jgi:hypothetical protein
MSSCAILTIGRRAFASPPLTSRGADADDRELGPCGRACTGHPAPASVLCQHLAELRIGPLGRRRHGNAVTALKGSDYRYSRVQLRPVRVLRNEDHGRA